MKTTTYQVRRNERSRCFESARPPTKIRTTRIQHTRTRPDRARLCGDVDVDVDDVGLVAIVPAVFVVILVFVFAGTTAATVTTTTTTPDTAVVVGVGDGVIVLCSYPRTTTTERTLPQNTVEYAKVLLETRRWTEEAATRTKQGSVFF